ncbi:YgaP family membrane protein [Algoriphagus namhaensis]
MKKNMGSTDRGIRLFIAAALVILFFSGQISGLIGTLALVIAGIFVLTSFVSFCPLYVALGLKTTKKA